MASKYNIVFEQGATFQRTINWKSPNGTPIDLTGYRIRMQVRKDFDSSTTYLDFDSANLAAGMHIGALNSTGVISITLDPSVTSTLSFQNADYDLVAISSGGTTYRLLQGKTTVSLGVTR